MLLENVRCIQSGSRRALEERSANGSYANFVWIRPVSSFNPNSGSVKAYASFGRYEGEYFLMDRLASLSPNVE